MNRSRMGPEAVLDGLEMVRWASKMALTFLFPPFSMARTSFSFPEESHERMWVVRDDVI